MQLTPAQQTIARDKHRFRVVNCGRRFGKTTLAVYEMLAAAISKKDKEVVYIAPTFDQARRLAWEPLKKIGSPVIHEANEGRLECKIRTRDGGLSTIRLFGWESVERMRGSKNDFLIPDEVSSYREFWVHWEEVLRPTLIDKKGEVLFLSTPEGFNHFYELYCLDPAQPAPPNGIKQDADFKSFHFTSYDNPNIPKEELDKAKTELTEDRFAQEIMADFRKTVGLVYKEFDRAKHLYNHDVVNVKETIAGVDFGFHNPCAVIIIKKDYDGNYWIDNEWYKTEKTDAMIAEYVSGLDLNKVYPDPESPGAIKELNSKGVPVRDVVKGKDSIKNGITKVRELFKTGRLKIHTRCQNLITELESYHYADRKPDHNEDENPVKENDHAMDAMRYALMMNMNSREVAHVYKPQQVTTYGPHYKSTMKAISDIAKSTQQ